MGGADAPEAAGGAPRIHRRAWRPPAGAARVRASIVIAHGAGEHSGRYAQVAERLVASGYAVHALDHRGHGRSAGRRALIDHLDGAVEDLGVVIAEVAAQNGGRPPFLLGHSMGATISLAYALRDQDRLAGLILSGPLATLPELNPPLRLLVRVLSRAAPGLGVSAVDPTLISRDPDQVRAYAEDPLVLHGRLPVRTIAELADAIDAFPRLVRDLRLPLLIVQGGADEVVSPEGARMLHERAGSEDSTLEVYDGLYHELFNETEPDRSRVLDDVVAWLDART